MPPHLTFTDEPLWQIVPAVRAVLAQRGEVRLDVPDPVTGAGLYAGEPLVGGGLYRPLTLWADLADALGAHLLSAAPEAAGRVRLHLRAFAAAPAPDAAGYDPDAGWGRVNKLEDPVFLLTFVEALRRVNPPAGGRVLALGVNAGHELGALALAYGERPLEVTGLDLDPAALAQAQERWPGATFVQRDAMTLPWPDLGRFDLIVALSLLQSPGIRQDVLLAGLRAHHLTPGGGLILGYPNARYRDGSLSYGARLRNFGRPDLSLLMADVTEARRRLHKQGYKVFVTGKYEVLVTAIPSGGPTPLGLEL